MAAFGICVSNKPGDLGFDQLKRIRPRYVVLMEGQAGAVKDIKRELPDCRIALRAEDSGRAWDPPAVGYSPEGYAADFAAFVEEHQPHIGIPWNEANIEWKSFFPDDTNCTPEQYQRFANWAAQFLRHYRRLTSIPIAWPAISPGHRTDDFEESSRILAPVAGLFDEEHWHFYYPDFSEWAGRRDRRELPFYAANTKPKVVTECNRPFNRNDAADVQRMVEDTRRFYTELGPYFTHICYFIENSDSFPELNSRGVGPLEDLFIQLAATPQEEPMPKPTSLTVTPLSAVVPGATISVAGHASGIDGVGMLTARIALPTKPDGYAYGVDTVVSGIPVNNGTFSFSIPVPVVNEDLDATLILNTLELDGSSGVYDAAEVSVPVKISQQAEAPEHPGDGIDWNAATIQLGSMWGHAQVARNRGLNDVADAIEASVIALKDALRMNG